MVKLPKKVDSFLRYIRALKSNYKSFFYDFKRFSFFSIQNTYPKDKTQLQSKIISLYHVIEKGLIMPKTRLGYGKDRIELLISLLKLYKGNFECSTSVHYKSALKVLQAYVDLHQTSDIDVDYIKTFLEKESIVNKESGGYFEVDKEFVLKKAKGDFLDLVDVRSSTRNFSDTPVAVDDIYEAITIAQKSPSTCNRQSTRVYVLTDKEKMRKVLELQGGSRGFDYKIDKLLIIGFDIKTYQGSGDRYTGYIDSSLFAMTLQYALTYKGLGCVSLNWSKPKDLDLELRKVINIEDSHNIIFFIGVGNLEEKTKIAVSTRYNLDDILFNG